MESTNERITLPASLAIIIWKELKEKHGMKQRMGANGLIDISFSLEEIGLITKLNIKNPTRGNFPGISALYNLQSLSISSDGNSAYKKSNDIYTINDKDIKEISKCTNLKNLSIDNQAGISYVDLQQLRNLQFLSITNNPKIEEIVGINKQDKLYSLNCYGNKNLLQLNGLSECIKQCPELSELNLDVLLFPDSIKFNSKTGEYDKETFDKINESSNTVKWHEALPYLKRTNTRRDSIQINQPQMLQLHNKSCQILANNVMEYANKKDTIMAIETYIAENIKYDYDAIKNKGGLRMSSNNGITIGSIGGVNGAYNAIMFNKCVCEGYTRAMQYLLKLKGIKSRNVSCIGTKDTLNMSDGKNETHHTGYRLPDEGYHSIICIEDEDCLYCDPCWDAGMYQQGDKRMPYALLNKAEISKTHTLSFEERRVNNQHIGVSRNTITESITRNELFRKTRLEAVQQAGKNIKDEVHKGQIIGEKETREV